MFRYAAGYSLYFLLTLVWVTPALQAAEPFDLPACVADLGTEVVLNPPMLEAMIAVVEPGGTQPDRQSEMLFIVVKYYLERSQGLLVVSRADALQRPLLLTRDCAPYPEAPTHIRTYVADLTPEQQRALVRYQELVWPRTHRLRARSGAMARIPAGPFKRGAGQTSTLEAFAIDVYEVTNAQYRQFLEAGGYTTQDLWSAEGWSWVQSKGRRQPSYWEDGQLNGPDQPVVGVTWYEAEAYCRWAGKALPTELQWEKACRGSDGRTFPWGNTPLPPDTVAAGIGPGQQALAVPLAVGSMPQTQSPYGVHDLAGNVLEWTSTTSDGQQVVLCGGSGSELQRVGCGVRYTLFPGMSANFIGFRCQAPTAR